MIFICSVEEEDEEEAEGMTIHIVYCSLYKEGGRKEEVFLNVLLT